LVKTGAGTLALAGASTYTGWTTNNSAAPIEIQHGSALGLTVGGTYIAAGGALWLRGGIAVGDEPLILNGGSPSGTGTLRSVNGDNTYGGLVTLAAGSIFGCTTNTLTLSNPGTITGSGSILTNFGNGNVTINSIIGTDSGGVLRLNGTGTLTLNGANTYTGPTTVAANAGALVVNGSIASGSSVTISSGGFLCGTGVISGPVTFAAGSHALFTNGATLTLGGDLTIATSGTIPNVYLNLSSNVPAGIYTLATYAGTLTGAFKETPTNLTGSFAAGTTNYITITGGSVVLHVEAIAGASPVANPDTASTYWNVPVMLTPLVNDTDPGLNPLSLVSVTPSSGTASIINNNTNVLFTPANGFTGAATIDYVITNGIGGTSNSIITVTVASPPTPNVTSVKASGGSLILTGTNGAPNGTYTIVASTNVALALASWTPILTNTFDGAGYFSNSIPVINTVPKNFYRVKQ
jgi:autotransporter-associated beta strand protein